MTQFGYKSLGFGAGGVATPYFVQYLVIAGAGAGGRCQGGGGGEPLLLNLLKF